MPDIKEIYEMVTKQAPPHPDPLRHQIERQAHVARVRKTAAIVVSVALIVSVVALGAIALRADHAGTPATDRSPSAVAGRTPPLGVQVIKLDGTVVDRVPIDAIDPGSVRVSPIGRTLVFYGVNGISAVAMDGTERVLVAGVPDRGGDAKHNLSWSPDGSRIAYSWHDDVWVMDANGSDRQRLTQAPSGTGSYFPSWSPDGSTIAFWRGSSDGRDGGPPDAEIYTIPATGGRPTRLTNDRVSSIEPAWSPDGSQIVYRTATPDGLVVMDADGSHAHVVTRDGTNPWAPSWSPDGTQIAYLACCADERALDGRPLLGVEVLDLATGDVTRLDVRVVTDLNGPVWASGETLLVNRYD
jgi:Tol biopolymer transport system component